MVVETKTQNLINAMDADRIRRGMDHKAFSALLGITASYWCMVRKGKRRPSLTLIETIHRQLPEVSSCVDLYTRPGKE